MQKSYIGVGAILNLKNILTERKPSRIFLVAGKGSYAASGAEARMKPLLSGYDTVRFSDFSPNPSVEEVQKGIAFFRANSPDLVIAVGGGSALDTAKSIAILAAHEGAPEEYIRSEKKIIADGTPLVAIPTTAGSGAEATQFAVVYVGGIKYSLADPRILPAYAILDPELTYTLPPLITASTGMDALCQAIESYWSVHSTHESKGYAHEAILLAYNNIRDAVKGGKELAREAMMRAAYLAGKAINISKTTSSHAMSYPLTMHFGIPHGHAVALTIGALLEFNDKASEEDVSDPRGLSYLRQTINEIIALMGAKDINSATAILRKLMIDIGLETQLSALGVASADFPLLVSELSTERASNNPRRFNGEAARGILESVL